MLTKIQCVSIISKVRCRRKEPGGGRRAANAAGSEAGSNGAGVQLTVVAIG